MTRYGITFGDSEVGLRKKYFGMKLFSERTNFIHLLYLDTSVLAPTPSIPIPSHTYTQPYPAIPIPAGCTGRYDIFEIETVRYGYDQVWVCLGMTKYRYDHVGGFIGRSWGKNILE